MDNKTVDSNESDKTSDGETYENEVFEGDNTPSFDIELRTFIAHITSLSVTLQISMDAVTSAFEKALEEFKEFEKANIIQQDVDGKKTVLVKVENLQRFQELSKQLQAYSLAFKTIPRSYIMSLISQYDAFLGRLLRVVFLSKPVLLNSSERNLTFSQLMEFGSVDDAKEFILEKEIDSVLRKSHAEQFQWMETKFDMPLRKGLDIWSNFVEVTERRNLFVHTGGVISSQYLKVCKEHDVVNISNLTVGKELTVSQEYFGQAYNIIFEIGFKLAHVLWRKFIPNELAGADSNLTSIGYDTLYEENYVLTKMIFDFATQTLKKHSKDGSRRIMIVNRALAYKWSGDDKTAKNIISQEDWSATRWRFRLAEAVLLDKYDDAYKIMQEIGKNQSEIEKKDYRDWPLFKAIKKEAKFIETFQKIFEEPYNKVDQHETQLLEEILSDDSEIIAKSKTATLE